MNISRAIALAARLDIRTANSDDLAPLLDYIRVGERYRAADGALMGAHVAARTWTRAARVVAREADTLTAEENTYGFRVEDSEGGVWWPNEETAEIINAAPNPAAMAIRIAACDPSAGTWRQ